MAAGNKCRNVTSTAVIAGCVVILLLSEPGLNSNVALFFLFLCFSPAVTHRFDRKTLERLFLMLPSQLLENSPEWHPELRSHC